MCVQSSWFLHVFIFFQKLETWNCTSNNFTATWRNGLIGRSFWASDIKHKRAVYTLFAWIILIRKNRVFMSLKKTSVETVGLSFGVRLHVGQQSTCGEARGRRDFNINSVS